MSTQTAFQDRYRRDPDRRHRLEADLELATRELLESVAEELAVFLAKRDDLRFDDPRAAAWVLVHALEGTVQAVAARGRSFDAAPVAAAACTMLRAYVAAAAVR